MLPIPSPAVVYKPVSDGAVLFDTGQEVYFGLNSVGARIWELLPPRSQTHDELVERLLELYPDVEESTLRQDVSELLEDLLTHGLLTPSARAQNATSDPAA